PFSFDKIPTKSDSFREFANAHLNKSGTIDSLIAHWDALKDNKSVKEFVLQFLSIDEKKYIGFRVADVPDCVSESGFSGNYRDLVVELKKLLTEKVKEECGGNLSNLDGYLDGLSLPGISKGQLIKVLFAKESQKQELSNALDIASKLLAHAGDIKASISFDILQNEGSEESKNLRMGVLASSIDNAKKQKTHALAFLELCSNLGSEDGLTVGEFKEVLGSLVEELQAKLTSGSPGIDSAEIEEQITALEVLKDSVPAGAAPVSFLKEQVKSSLRFTAEIAGGEEVLEALLPHLDALDLLEINQAKERWSQTGLINSKRHEVQDGDVPTEEGNRYRSYIQKVAAFLQVYKKARRGDLVLNDAELLALEQKLQGLQGNFAADLESGALSALLEEGELSFFKSLFNGKDYKLSYPASLSEEVQRVKDRRNSTFSALNSARKRITGLTAGTLYPYETLGNGACGINAFIYDIIGLVHQGRYRESDLIEKLRVFPGGQAEYERLRDKYTTSGEQPFCDLFADRTPPESKLSKSDLDRETKEIELALELFFRGIIVDSLLPKEGLDDVSGFDVHPGSTEVNLEFNEHVSISKGDSLAVLHQYLYVDFMRGVYQAAGVEYGRDKSSPKSDFFNYCSSLPGEAAIKGKEFYAAIPQEIKDQLESSEDKAAVLDKCIREGFTKGDLPNEWKEFLKSSLETYVNTSVAPLQRWIGTGELAVLAESFSSDQLFLNVFTRNASHNLSNVIQIYGRVPEALLSDAPDGSLIKDRKEFMRKMDFINPQGYLQEMPRQKIITEIAHKRESMLQEFKELFESSSEDFLATVEKLNRELDEMQELMLRCHDQYYLRESNDSPNRKHIVLIGTSNPHAGHFEAVTAGDYSFDLSVPIGAEYGTSYDDVDEWSTTCLEIDKILHKDPLSKDDIREACALLEYKMSCIGSEEHYPEKIIELKGRLTELSKLNLLSPDSEELSLDDLHAGTLADSIPSGYSLPEAESKFEDIQEVTLPASTKVAYSTMKYGEAVISLKPLGENGYDLFTEDVEVIVNAANTGMLGGGGVDGAVNKFNTGSGLAKERQDLKTRYGSRIKTGGAFLTAAYNYSQENRDVLSSHDKNGDVITPGGKTLGTVKSIVHAIGPSGEASDEKDTQLALAYKNACLLAHRKGLSSIAFPVLSVGVFNYPVDRAASALLKGIQNFLDEYPDTSLKDIRVIGQYEAIKAKAKASAEKAGDHSSTNSLDTLSSEVLAGLDLDDGVLFATEAGSLGEEVTPPSSASEGNE
ncbi:MAG: hypothetical protein GWP59_07960, partial [Chlamydiales bacterium]|nr:hypothetical protein [Chlamydiales bacterium]